MIFFFFFPPIQIPQYFELENVNVVLLIMNFFPLTCIIDQCKFNFCRRNSTGELNGSLRFESVTKYSAKA